jgi:hypothetical protein
MNRASVPGRLVAITVAAVLAAGCALHRPTRSARRVRYWIMQAVRGEFRPNDEVDEIRWTPLGLVSELITHEHDLFLVSGLCLVGADVA